jgi:hypothetical protein
MIGGERPDGVHHRLRVFLSGRIDGVDLAEASRWREIATLRLGDDGFDVYDPTQVMRAESGNYRPTANEVFTNDRWNLARCDLVLVNLTLPAMLRNRDVPFFTIGEMFLAHQAGLPLIVFGSCLEGRPGYDAIVTRSFPELDDAIRYIVATYGSMCASPRSALP